MPLSVEEHQRLVADRRSVVDWSADDDVDLETRPTDLRLSVPDL